MIVLEAAEVTEGALGKMLESLLVGDFAGVLSSPFATALLLEGATDEEDLAGERALF